MSTRGQLYVKGSDVVLYRHSDCYPEGKYGVLACILPFLADFEKYRGVDPDYGSAQLLGHLIKTAHKADDARRRWRKKHRPGDNPEDYKQYRYLGFGVEAFDLQKPILHGDIEYFYVVDQHTQTVELRVPSSDTEIYGIRANPNFDVFASCILIATFKFGAKPPRGDLNSIKSKFVEKNRPKKGRKTPATATT